MDAAFKIGRCLQIRYEDVRILVPGICKGAGAILATAANELVFSSCYGELGPIDIQQMKKDSMREQESGLDIAEGLAKIEERAAKLFHQVMSDTLCGRYGGPVTTAQTASDSAARFVSSLFGPPLARIDPKEIGKRSRAMRVAQDYGKRLNYRFGNLDFTSPEDTASNSNLYVLDFLSQRCPSHGFVIDIAETMALLKRVRSASESEEGIVKEYRLPADKITTGNITGKFLEIEADTIKKMRQDSKKPKRPNKKSKSVRATANGASESSS